MTVEKLVGRKARGWQWIFTFIILSFGQEGLGFSRGQDSAICTGTTDMTPVGLCKSLSTRILTVRHILLHTQELTSLKGTKPTHQTSILTTQHLIPELWNDRTLGSAQVWHLQVKVMYCNLEDTDHKIEPSKRMRHETQQVTHLYWAHAALQHALCYSAIKWCVFHNDWTGFLGLIKLFYKLMEFSLYVKARNQNHFTLWATYWILNSPFSQYKEF